MRSRCRTSTALGCTLATLIAISATPASAANECGPIPLDGQLTCPQADYPNGIEYSVSIPDLSVVVPTGSSLEGTLHLEGLFGVTNLSAFANGAAISTTADDTPGIYLDSTFGDLTIAADDVTTSGNRSDGVLALANYGNVTINSGIKGQNGSIATFGDESDAIHAEAGGDIQINVADIDTSGTHSDGIEAHSTNGGVSIFSSNIETNGDFSSAINATGRYDVDIQAGSISASASNEHYAADAIHAVSYAGNIGISVDDLTTAFDRGIFARADYGSIDVNAGTINTTGAGGQAMLLFAGGDVDVTTGDVTTHSDAFLGDGIVAYSGGKITISAGNVNTYGGHSSAILGYGTYGVQIDANDVTVGYNTYWGSVAAGEAITGLAPYGDVTIHAHNVYSQGRGIAAEVFVGNVDVTANNIVAGADAPYSEGIYAFTFYGDINVSVNSVQTVHSAAIYLNDHWGNVDLGFGSTAGTGAGVIVTAGYAGGTVNIDGDSIVTSGEYNPGLNVFTYGETSNIDIGAIDTDGLIAQGVLISNGFSFGFNYETYDFAFYYGTTNFRSNSVRTHGDYSDAVTIRSNSGDIYARVGEISTDGFASAGLVLIDSGAHLAPPNNELGVPLTFFRPMDFNVGVDSIVTSGDYSTAIAGYMQEGTLELNVGSIETRGNSASGIYLEGGAVVFGAPGSETFDINVGAIETYGDTSNGVIIKGNGGDVDIAVDHLTTHGANSSGIAALGFGDINITSGTLDLEVADPSLGTYYTTGIYAASFGGNVSIDADQVTTGADKSNAIFVNSFGRVGYFGDVYHGSIDVAAANVTTAGADASAVVANASGGEVHLTIGNVGTVGDGSAGIVATALEFVPGYGAEDHLLYGGDIDLTANSVTTAGDHASGVVIQQLSGGNVNADVGTVATSGDYSAGVAAINDPASNSYTGETYIGDVALNVHSANTTGDNSDGVFLYMSGGNAQVTVDSAVTSGADSRAIDAVNMGSGSVGIEVTKAAHSDQSAAIAAESHGDLSIAVDDGAKVDGPVAIMLANYGSATIANSGEVSGPIAIGATGPGALTVGNDGNIFGTVRLSGAKDTFNNDGLWAVSGDSDFGAGDDVLNNSGTWMSSGKTEFGVGYDTLSNSGTILLSAPSASDPTAITGLEVFNNSHKLLIDAGAANGTVAIGGLQLLDNSGLISLVDGKAGQTLDLGGAVFNGSGNGTVALDVSAASGALVADKIKVGLPTGTTAIVVSGTTTFGSAVVVDAQSSFGPTNFVLANPDLGFTHLSLSYNAAASDWSLIAAPDTEVFETSRFAGAAQSLWHRGVDAWSQMVRDNRGDERPGFNIWGHFLGGHEKIGSRGGFDVLGSTFTPSLGTDANWTGFQVGAEFRRGNWAWGVMGGSISEKTRFTFDSNKLSLNGANLGAYTAYRNGKFFFDGLVDYQNIGGQADLTTAAFKDDASGHVLGFQADAGAVLNAGLFVVQPEIGISHSAGKLNGMSGAGATIDFNPFQSTQLHGGMRFSGVVRSRSVAIRPYVGLYVVDEIGGDHTLDFTTSGQTLRLSDKARPGYAEGTAGVVVDAGRGFRFSVGGQADFLGGHNAWKGLVGLSWRG